MHTINSLRNALGLSTANQVRNRIEAIKDVLAPHLRRGPNNQIMLTDGGLAMLRQMQELYDSGLTLTEASDVLRAQAYHRNETRPSVSSALPSKDAKPDDTHAVVETLRSEIAFLRDRVAFLEQAVASREPASAAADAPGWWNALLGEIDAS